MDSLITLLIPCYNEERCLQTLVDKLRSVLDSMTDFRYEILLVNDGSCDATAMILEQMSRQIQTLKYITLSRNFGKEAAMLAGFDYAKGDCVIVMDADFQHPVELIPQMINLWQQGFDDVYARRTNRDDEGVAKQMLSCLYYKLLQKTSDYDVLRDVGDFRLLDRKCVDVMKCLREKERNTKALFAWIGFRKIELAYTPANRASGSSRWKTSQLVKLAFDGITSFTTAPLRIATALGLIVSFIAFVYLIVVLVKTILWGDPVAGYPSMMAVVLCLGGVQLLCIGIMGEYLARIFSESKKRPVYVVEKTNVE